MNQRKKSEKMNKQKSTVEADVVKETDAAAKEKLLIEIRSLKLLITQTECKLHYTRFGDLSENEDIEMPGKSAPIGSTELTDFEAIVQNELYSFAGFSCKKIDDTLVVAFQSRHENFYTNDNWVELFKKEEGWKLGQWMMPMGINVKTIFDKYSMSASANMKNFLKDCKHLVDCHNRREEEFKRLEAFMSHMKRYGCSLEANFGYTNVTMKLMMKQLDASTNGTQQIFVNLVSSSDNARPSRVFVDREGENELSREERKQFSKMFHCFKELDMVDAAKQVLASPDSLFIWKDPSIDDSVVEINDDEGIEMDTSFSRLLQEKSSVAKKRRVAKSKTVEENSNDTREKDLSVDVIYVSGGGVDDASQVDRRRSTKRKLETPKEAVPAKRKSRVSDIIAVAKTNDRENISAAKISDKSKIPGASRKKNVPLKDCNQNIISSFFKNAPSETAEEPPKNNDKIKLATPKLASPKFFKSIHRRRNNASPAGDEISAEKRKNTDVADFESKLKKSRANGIGSVLTWRGRSAIPLQCSTPITECISVLSTMDKENISAITKVNTITPRRAVGAEKIDVTDDSDDSDEKDLSKVCNDHEALLKDLQAVKYNNKNATGKAATKSTKQKNIKVPLRGRNKFPKK